jgi:3-hydroxy acid dehydrogenase / malonic semialdehyde reductase
MSTTILVTGATAGFGAAMTRRFVRDGHRVIAVARRTDRLQALRHELGSAALPVELDVTNPETVAALPASLPSAWRDVDVLVNNAGLARGLDPAHKATLADWDEMVAVNVSGMMHMSHALLPGMMERNRGHIINISSTAAIYPYPGGHVYGASKAFVTQFSLNLRADVVGTAVRVTDLEPGLVGGTEFSVNRFGGNTTLARAVYAGRVPLRADDIAEAAAWVIGLPLHMNINRMEIMPTCQAPGPLAIKRS